MDGQGRDIDGPFRVERTGEIFVREGAAIDGFSARAVSFRKVLRRSLRRSVKREQDEGRTSALDHEVLY